MWPRRIRTSWRLAARPCLEGLEDRTLLSGGTFQYDYAADPSGRAVLVHLDQGVSLSAPWDRFRFDVSETRPLMRDGSAFLGDVTGDGVRDLLTSDVYGNVTLYPGLPGNPSHFGQGTLLRYATSAPTDDPYNSDDTAGLWNGGALGDLKGNGVQEMIIGRFVYSLTGSPSAPALQKVYTFTGVGNYHIAPALGDLNGDGKPDVVLTSDDAGSAYVCWNTSSGGSISFSAPQALITWINDPTWEHNARSNHISLGDLNGDGLLDLATPAGIYYNTGTATSPSFSAASLTAWNRSGGPDWLAASDLPPRVTLVDANGDGLLDAYYSSPSLYYGNHTLDQVLYYQNVGTAQSPVLQYMGPVTVTGTPANLFYFGQDAPSASGNRASIATADFNGDGQPEITAISWQFDHTATIFGVPGAGGQTAFAFQDTYTFPTLSQVTTPPSDALLSPPGLVGAWVDANGDGLPDLFAYSDIEFNAQAPLKLYLRSGTAPFTLDSGTAVTTTSGAAVMVCGFNLVDVDKDGHPDLVTGAPNGELMYYRNTATNGGFAFADPVPLTNSSGTPISVGQNSWPTAIDLNGDGNMDFLVSGQDGLIRKVMCQTPGSASGYALGGLLATTDQNPLQVTHISGGGDVAPSLATLDFDHDGKMDVVMGDFPGRVWLLHNVGTATAASFALEPLEITRTTAADLEVVDSQTVRLYFSVPVSPDATISFDDLPSSGGPVSGTAALPLTFTVSPVTPSPRHTPVSSVDVTFSRSIDPSTLTSADLTLTRNGNPVPLNSTVTASLVSGSTYRIKGLDGFTAAEGTYVLTVQGSGIQDTGGNAASGTGSATWVMDTTPPTAGVAAVSPNPRNSAVASLTITFSEPVSGFDLADLGLSRDGSVQPLTGATLSSSDNVTWTLGNLAALTSSAGNYTLTLTAGGSGIQDAAGNALAGDAVTTWLVDTTPPSSTVAALPAFTAGASFAVTWSGSDDATGIAGYDVYVSDNGSPFTRWLAGTPGTSATYSGADGHHYGFYSVATDRAGNREAAPASAEASTTVDTSAPSSTVAALPAFSPGSFTLSWSGSDGPAGSGIASYDVYVSDNGAPFTPLLTGTSLTSTSFTGVDGHTYGFYSVATDNVGNRQAAPAGAQTSTTVDTAPPDSTVAALPDFSPATFTLTWSGSDNAGGSGIATYDVYVSDNGGAFTPLLSGTSQTSTSFTGVDRHTYTFYSVATDRAGNRQPAPADPQALTTVDAVAPASSVGALPAFTGSASFTVSWSGDDNAGGSGLATYDVFVSDNGGPFKPFHTGTAATSAAFTGSTGHRYGFYSVAVDNVGNREKAPSTAQASTTVDTSPPSSRVAALPAFTGSSHFTVSWSGSDGTAGSGIAGYDVYVSDNGGPFTPFQTGTTQTSATFTGVNGHSYGFYSVATDNVGNRQPTPTTAQATTTVDTTAPTSSVTALPAFSPGSFTLSWSGSDNSGGSGIASYDVYVSDNGTPFTAFQTATTQTSAPFTGQDGHSYRFYSVATDVAGNREGTLGATQATTTVDAVAPTSAVTALPPFTGAATFTVSWSGSDNSGGSGIAGYEIYVSDNGAPFTLFQPATAQTSAPFTGQDGHTYAFYSVATDQVGNREANLSAQATTTVDLTPPGSSVTALPAFSPGTFSVSWAGQDNPGGSGIAGYDVYVSDNGNPVTLFQTATTQTSAPFTGQDGHTYSFYSVATDKAGNRQANSTSQTSTTVDTQLPSSSVTALPAFSPHTFTLSWSGSDNAGGSGIASYDIFVSDNGAPFHSLLARTTQTSTSFTGRDGHLYAFYSVATDQAGNQEQAPLTGQAATVVLPVGFSISNGKLSVQGTPGNDHFAFSAGRVFTVTLNQTTYRVNSRLVNAVSFSGGGGSDSATLTDQTAAQFTLHPGAAHVKGLGYTLDVSGVKAISVIGSGVGSVTLHDGRGNDAFVSTPKTASLSGGGFFSQASGFGKVVAFSTGGKDTATLTGSAAADSFVGKPLLATLSGKGYSDVLNHFAVVNVSGGGGNDTANLYDGKGNDTLTAAGSTATLLGPGYSLGVSKFHKVTAHATAGGVNKKRVSAVDFVFEALGRWS